MAETAGRQGMKVKRQSLVDQVYQMLRDRIQEGTLESGERLNIESLAAEFGVSRTPMREAISRLAQDGFVEIRHNASPRVAELDPERVREIAIANTVLMEGMMDFYLNTVSEEEIQRLCAELREILEEQRSSMDDGRRAEFLKLSIRFHEQLIRACPNQLLQEYAMNTQVQLTLFIGPYQKDESFREKSVHDHAQILKCLEAGDRDGLRAALHEHNTSPIGFFDRQ